MNRPKTYSELTKDHLTMLHRLAYLKNYDQCNQCDLSNLINYNESIKVEKQTLKYFNLMSENAKKDNIDLHIVSGFRDLDLQTKLFFGNYQGARDSITELYNEIQYLTRMRWVAVPGFSEHHTGKAIDLCIDDLGFEDTDEFRWLMSNAYKYGFRLSYPKICSKGAGFEPWHWLFVG